MTSFVRAFQDSIILSALFHFFEKTRFLLTHGFFARVFTAYSEEERLLGNGLFSLDSRRKGRRGELAASAKRNVAKAFEDSFFAGWLERWCSSILYRRTRTYGAFLLSLGVSGTLVYIFREFILEDTLAWNGNWVFTLGSILLSVPLLVCRQTLAGAVLESWILSPILFEYLGFLRESFLLKRKEPKHYGVASALGIALGVLTYFISPVYYFISFGVLLGSIILFRFPEIGVLLLVAMVPFLHYTGHPTFFLATSVLTVGFAYFLKWIRAKRIWSLRLMDRAVLAMAVVFLLNGAVSVGGAISFGTAFLYVVVLIAYLLMVNLLRSREWIRKTWMTMLVFGLFSCVSGIAEIFTGAVNASWVDMRSFSGTVRVTGGFENPNVYAEYLLILIPLSFLFFLEQKRTVGRWLAIGALAVLALCMVNTWSRGAWLGLMVAVVTYWLIMDKRSPIFLLAAVLVAPWATYFLPSSVFSRLLSIGNLGDSSVSYRFSVWKGVWRMLRETFWCGTGVGYSAFSALYPIFAYGGSVGVRHAHSFYLQILVEFGIVGFIIMAAVLFLFAQMCFEYFLKMRDRKEKRLSVVGLSSIVGSLVMGLTDHIWYDYRIFFCFWAVIALVSAHVRVTLAEQERQDLPYENSAEEASLEIGINS